MSQTKLHLAIEQIRFAREYSGALAATVAPEDWYTIPEGCPTHLAWQMGHLAMAQYGLTMLRIRGKEREDEELLSKSFFRTFQKGTTPSRDQSVYPSVDEIQQTLARVHEASLAELAHYQDEDLEEKLPEPYAVFDTKLGSLLFCSAHELIHAGQIGVWRRMMGMSPLR